MYRNHVRPRFWGIILVVLLILTMVLFISSNRALARSQSAYAEAIAQRDELLDAEEVLKDELSFAGTNDYIIRTARAELDMLMPGEVRYRSN